MTNYYAKPGVAEIKLETGGLSTGDELLITGPSTGIVELTVKELRDALEKDSAKVMKGELCAVKTDGIVRRSDKVFKWVDASSLKNE